MNTATRRRMHAAALLAALATAGCSGATKQATTAPQPAREGGGPRESTITTPPPNAADVRFVTGMIPHHAQAVLIAGWAQSHGARLDVLALCQRIVVGQTDEIALMSYWLKEHGQPVPDPKSMKMSMKMDGMDMDHGMLMPGMLSDEQLAELDKARGPDFDRLFLKDMIGHHEGAITMVNELLASTGAAQDDVIYRMSSDVYADQTTEIERMGKMLAATPPSRNP